MYAYFIRVICESANSKFMDFIVTSNIFLFIPVLIAAKKGEWLYFILALALCVSSPIFHYLYSHNTKSVLFGPIRKTDWIIAITSYIYMFYFIFAKIRQYQLLLTFLLVATALFFFYGYKFGNYKKLHPWFHIFAPIISGIIIYLKP